MDALTTTTYTFFPAGILHRVPASRLRLYELWLSERGRSWLQPDLAGWRDHLFARGLEPRTVAAYLATVRTRYLHILDDNAFRDMLYRHAPDGDPADRRAFVEEARTRMRNAVNVRVPLAVEQDRADSEFRRLTPAQAHALLDMPQRTWGEDVPVALRDEAMIALMLCAGLREQEVCDLDVADLRQRLDGQLALRVRRGKGKKKRLIPYGDMDWALAVADAWLEVAGITEGPVFRGFTKGYAGIRAGRIEVSTIRRALARYPIEVDGETVVVRPHDLRRTYARRLYEVGLPVVGIQANLGHDNAETTWLYIGAAKTDERTPPAVYSTP